MNIFLMYREDDRRFVYQNKNENHEQYMKPLDCV